MNHNKEIRVIVRKVLNEVITFAGGSAWDSNNDISLFHGYPSGYSEFPYLRTDTPDMLPDSEEVNYENELNSEKEKNFITDSKEFKEALNNEIKNCIENHEFINIHAIAKSVLQKLKSTKNEND